MEKHGQGLVDLLEIYHARQVRDDLVQQLRRLRQSQQLPLCEHARRKEVRRHYEMLLSSITDLLRQLGDEVPSG